MAMLKNQMVLFLVDNMLGLPGGFARNFNMWGGVGWGVSTLVFMCTHGTLLVC